MSSLILKIIAVASMLVDHTGSVFERQLPEFAPYLRMFGRLAFPIFCFLIAEGYIKSRNVQKYALRLLVLAVLSEIPFDMMVGARIQNDPVFINYASQNVFFTLFLGLIAIWAIDFNTKLHRPWKGWSIALICMFLASLIRADYGIFGVAFIVVFSVFRGNHFRIILGFLGVLVVRYFLAHMGFHLGDMMIGQPFISTPTPRQLEWAAVNLLAGFSLPLIFMYNGHRGYDNKVLKCGFYAFYPVHMTILVAIHALV